MSLFEWFAEDYNPGARGGLGQARVQTLNWSGLALGGAGLALLTANMVFIFAVGFTSEPTLLRVLLTFLGVGCYHLAAFLFQPRPAYNNVGWFGGLVDNPLRISDDFNRALITFKIVLMPGLLLLRIGKTLLS